MYDIPAALPAMPRFDLEGWAALQRANIETAIAAQKIVFELVQAVARKQAAMVKEWMPRSELVLKGLDVKAQPQFYADEVKAAVEKTMADVKETIDLGFEAQGKVAELFARRAAANFEEIKALAA